LASDDDVLEGFEGFAGVAVEDVVLDELSDDEEPFEPVPVEPLSEPDELVEEVDVLVEEVLLRLSFL
jgi:hypothetical protein